MSRRRAREWYLAARDPPMETSPGHRGGRTVIDAASAIEREAAAGWLHAARREHPRAGRRWSWGLGRRGRKRWPHGGTERSDCTVFALAMRFGIVAGLGR
eukprot:2733694-Rhodomonas_salina.1